MYVLEFENDWKKYFRSVPPDIQLRFKKRLEKYENFPTVSFRHEKHGLDYFVDEIGQYRVLFTSEETSKIRRFYFIGDHKEYEKFLGTRN
ncbi:MAG: hypothetical protein Q7S22_07065 [Candidatus Micrarchaeota archaeon]|nr:hypothetical protein [Candidatus Micrarchaeota archaeon]